MIDKKPPTKKMINANLKMYSDMDKELKKYDKSIIFKGVEPGDPKITTKQAIKEFKNWLSTLDITTNKKIELFNIFTNTINN